MNTRQSPEGIQNKKNAGEKIVMLTAYDYGFAGLIDQCDVDIILVGDSLANVVLGLESTRQVDMDIMLHHTQAVNRAVKKALLVGDMPYGSYQSDPRLGVKNARRFVEQGGCNAVKIEWFDNCLQVTKEILAAGIPVMGHVGLTPQSVESPSGSKVQGKDAKAAEEIIQNALALQEQGCFCLVLECIPDQLAALITERMMIPTIGIGAGVHCDGQVLVIHDLLGLFQGFHPKFAKKYVSVADLVFKGVKQFRQEVLEGKFPDSAHSYHISPEELNKLKGSL